jgi:hypothetical protein
MPLVSLGAKEPTRSDTSDRREPHITIQKYATSVTESDNKRLARVQLHRHASTLHHARERLRPFRAGQPVGVHGRVALLTAVVIAGAGCGVPGSVAEQADEIASVAAEGELLAHDAAEGHTFRVFTRVHAEALEKRLTRLRPKVADKRVSMLLARVGNALNELAGAPGNSDLAARLERELASAAEEAEALAR